MTTAIVQQIPTINNFQDLFMQLPAIIDRMGDRIAGSVSRVLTASDSQQMAMIGMSCDMTLSPRSRAAIYANDRDRFIPDVGTAPSAILNNLPAGGESARLTISSDAIARGFKMTFVQLDSTTSYNDVVMNVFVGGIRRYRFSGPQLDPTTNNGCISTACQERICAGSQELIEVSFTNVGAAALSATANVRVQGNILLDGDPEFAGCWGSACKLAGLPTPKLTPGSDCSCKMPSAPIG